LFLSKYNRSSIQLKTLKTKLEQCPDSLFAKTTVSLIELKEVVISG